MIASTQYQLAAGHDNTAGLTSLHLISPPLLGFYRTQGPLTEWHDYQLRVLDGERRWQAIGLPWVVWIFEALSEAELALLRDTYALGGGLDAEVTLRTYNKRWGVFLTYNALLAWPGDDEIAWSNGGWRNVRVTFSDLVLLSGFSTGLDPRAFGV